MNHRICHVRRFEIVGAYTLQIEFDDRTQQTIDFQPILAGELYGPLRDRALFDRVGIDPEVRTLVWPNGADFDPAVLHDWPEHAEHFRARAREWEEAAMASSRQKVDRQT